MVEYGYAKKIPSWLKPLEKGQYTINEICEITGQRYNNVYKRLRHFDVEVCLIKIYGKRIVKYNWEGHQYYTDKFEKEKFIAKMKGK